MGKAAGVVALMFMVGGGAVTLFSNLLGAHAEAAALALVGAGMVATGQLLGSAKTVRAPGGSEEVANS